MPLNSPVRLIPAVGVTTGAHYRTLLMFFMFQKIILASSPTRSLQLRVLLGEDIPLQAFIALFIRLVCGCIRIDLGGREGFHIRSSSSELRAVGYLGSGWRYSDLAYDTRVLSTVLLCGVVLGFAVELTRHLVDELHGFEFTHSVRQSNESKIKQKLSKKIKDPF